MRHNARIVLSLLEFRDRFFDEILRTPVVLLIVFIYAKNEGAYRTEY